MSILKGIAEKVRQGEPVSSEELRRAHLLLALETATVAEDYVVEALARQEEADERLEEYFVSAGLVESPHAVADGVG